LSLTRSLAGLYSQDLSDETDLSYYDRGRLETEFRKLKEMKRKAEQYAVEAKQTAQRLSAENFKLREDLSRERHYNELERKNMLREMEQHLGKRTSREDRADAKMEVMDQEIFHRAQDIVRNLPGPLDQAKMLRGMAMTYSDSLKTGFRLTYICLQLVIQFVPNIHWAGEQYFLFLSPSYILIFPTFCPYLSLTFPLPTFLSCRTARDSEGPHSEPEDHSQHAPHRFRRSALLREVHTHQESPEHSGYVLPSGEHM